MWTIGGIDHVVVWGCDLERSMAFYADLGFEIDQKTLVRHRAEKSPFVGVNAGPNLHMDLRPDPNWVPVEREMGNMQHVNVTIDGVDDIQFLFDELAARGLTPDCGPVVQDDSWRIDIYDPDNSPFEMAISVPAHRD